MNAFTQSKDRPTPVRMDLMESCYPAPRQSTPTTVHMSNISSPLTEQDAKNSEQQNYQNMLSPSPTHGESSRTPYNYETISSPLSPLLIHPELDSDAASHLLGPSGDLMLDQSPSSDANGNSNSPTETDGEVSEEPLLLHSPDMYGESPEMNRTPIPNFCSDKPKRRTRKPNPKDARIPQASSRRSDRLRAKTSDDDSDAASSAVETMNSVTTTLEVNVSSVATNSAAPLSPASEIPPRVSSTTPEPSFHSPDFPDSPLGSPDVWSDLPPPSRSSLTLSSSHGSSNPLSNSDLSLDEPDEPDAEVEEPREFDPFEVLRTGEYEPPAVGVAFQVTHIPDVLSEPQRRQLEQRNRTLEPTLVFQPPLNPDQVYGSHFEKMIKKIKEMIPQVEEDRFLQVYFQHDYDDLDAIAYAVKHQKELIFHRRESFSPLEKTLFETGLRQFGKNFIEIQKLIKSKTLEEVMTFYYYWRATSRTEFLHYLENQLPNVRELHRARALLVLQRLQREGKDPGLMKFHVDIDSDWMRHEIYPYTPQHDGAYIRVKNGNRMRETPPPAVSSLHKRSPLRCDSPAPSKRARHL